MDSYDIWNWLEFGLWFRPFSIPGLLFTAVQALLKRPRLERFHCENTVRTHLDVTFQNLLQHLSGEPECVKIHMTCNRSAQTRPRLERFHCEYRVREEGGGRGRGGEGGGEEEGGRSWRCARKTRTPHKGCGE